MKTGNVEKIQKKIDPRRVLFKNPNPDGQKRSQHNLSLDSFFPFYRYCLDWRAVLI